MKISFNSNFNTGVKRSFLKSGIVKENDNVKNSSKLTPPSRAISNPISAVQPAFLSFLGNINTSSDFQKTIDFNYFKLPKVTLKNGEVYQIKPDKGQVECAQKIYNGDNTILEASTGAGKTALAHYAVNKNLYDGKKTIITVPLISLANDKYREFSAIYGEENVGLLTGVKKVNTDAPITIMVTEILRNQAQDLKEHSSEIGTIVFDEAHYIADEDRGAVWENSIIAAVKSDIQILCLSATLGNGKDFTDWVGSLNPNREVSRVEISTDDRFVPLSYSVYRPDVDGYEGEFVPIIRGQVHLEHIDENNLTDKQKRALAEIYTTVNDKGEFYEMNDAEYISALRNLKIKTDGDNRFFYEYQFRDVLSEKYPELDKNQVEKVCQLLLEDKSIDRVKVPALEEADYPRLVEDLQNEQMIPALIFKLSQKGCDDIQDELVGSGLDLTTREEKRQISETIDRYLSEGAFFGDDFDEYALSKGYGVHHAGKAPDYQKLVEELFSKKLLKVVSATSTLSAGINMPVRTVVMTDVDYMKYDPRTKQVEKTPLTASEFHQMAGRAGRRGIDSVGYVVLYNIASKKPNAGGKNKNHGKYYTSSINNNKPASNSLKFAYDLIESKPNELKSSFKPEPCMIAQYYYENGTRDNIVNTVGDSFKVLLSGKSENKKNALVKQFDNYTAILKNQGFIKNQGDKTVLTPKGELLRVSMGANPIMVSSLIYEHKLDKVSAENLCQIAGYIGNSDIQREDMMFSNIIRLRLNSMISDDIDCDEQIEKFENTRNLYKSKERSIINSMTENGKDANELEVAESFGAMVTYLFAHLNNQSYDSAANFKYLVEEGLKPIEYERGVPFELVDNSSLARKEFNRKATQGRTFKAIAQSISVLEQIERVCEHAIENPQLFPDQEYYEELKAKAKKAQSLINQKPLNSGAKA